MNLGQLWKSRQPGITYERAFVYATIISTLLMGTAGYFFSAVVNPAMNKELKVNFMNAQEAQQVVEKVHTLEEQEQARAESGAIGSAGQKGGGSGHGGQAGTSHTMKASNTKTVDAAASNGDISQVKGSPIGGVGSDGLVGAPGTGVGEGVGTGYGNGSNEGSGAGDGYGSGTGEGTSDGGTFDPSGYNATLQENAQDAYPVQALQRNISGEVTLSITFGADGSVIDVQVISESNPILGRDATKKAWSAGSSINTTGQSQVATVTVYYSL